MKLAAPPPTPSNAKRAMTRAVRAGPNGFFWDELDTGTDVSRRDPLLNSTGGICSMVAGMGPTIEGSVVSGPPAAIFRRATKMADAFSYRSSGA
jgi:hypothetical protein